MCVMYVRVCMWCVWCMWGYVCDVCDVCEGMYVMCVMYVRVCMWCMWGYVCDVCEGMYVMYVRESQRGSGINPALPEAHSPGLTATHASFSDNLAHLLSNLRAVLLMFLGLFLLSKPPSWSCCLASVPLPSHGPLSQSLQPFPENSPQPTSLLIHTDLIPPFTSSLSICSWAEHFPQPLQHSPRV